MYHNLPNASQVQAINAQRKKSHCFELSNLNTVIGFSTLSIGGFSVLNRVAKYRPALIFSGVSPVPGSRASSRPSSWYSGDQSRFPSDIVPA
jgi:hypothetical protein